MKGTGGSGKTRKTTRTPRKPQKEHPRTGVQKTSPLTKRGKNKRRQTEKKREGIRPAKGLVNRGRENEQKNLKRERTGLLQKKQRCPNSRKEEPLLTGKKCLGLGFFSRNHKYEPNEAKSELRRPITLEGNLDLEEE